MGPIFGQDLAEFAQESEFTLDPIPGGRHFAPGMQPNEKADFYGAVPGKCPKCGGKLKDYNAETAASGKGREDPGLIVHLFVCLACGEKRFAPPTHRDQGPGPA
jgi:hypothetical protein